MSNYSSIIGVKHLVNRNGIYKNGIYKNWIYKCLINRLMVQFDNYVVAFGNFSAQPIRLNLNQRLLGTYPKVEIGHVVYQRLHAFA